ncbi:DNA polymerase III subunit chi [Litorilituus sediminis]|uniref:DNA polymerase III subunit chi n=1 Tax=Litorilituus sediminis TaxID=718192 RepID=A0A4P6P7R8_9GAMM|nr:DNA polymerase III subunit chi [Litorilituus sediminis]QBG35562.1 DNA polymerase III subunit chi [Litorilituus sediminis]
MQTQVMFYVLPENKAESTDTNMSSEIQQACIQASYFYRQGHKVFIFCQDKDHAENVDEVLWAFDTDSFVPHNLAGEGPKQGSPVEISYQAPTSRRSVLINLSKDMPNFANRFNFIVDFVPTDSTLKQQARERFKTCRQWGFHVESQAIVENS